MLSKAVLIGSGLLVAMAITPTPLFVGKGHPVSNLSLELICFSTAVALSLLATRLYFSGKPLSPRVTWVLTTGCPLTGKSRARPTALLLMLAALVVASFDRRFMRSHLPQEEHRCVRLSSECAGRVIRTQRLRSVIRSNICIRGIELTQWTEISL